MARRQAPGIPDRDVYGDLANLFPGLYPYVVQKHEAHRAGLHDDLRMGKGRMYSWAVPRYVPESGGHPRLAIQQALHGQPYMHFQGIIPKPAYGAGRVTTKDKGEVLVTKVKPDQINYTTAHTRYPERFVLKKLPKGRDWMLINVTPTEAPTAEKPRYKLVRGEDIAKYFKPGMKWEAKVDGARVLGKVLKDKIEVMSYRTSAKGRPILHTERLTGRNIPEKIPQEMIGKEFVGELYGLRGGKAIPPEELGGILNSTIAKALRDKAQKNVKMRVAIFDMLNAENRKRSDRKAEIRKMVKELGGPFHTLPEVGNAKAKDLLDRIASGKHPLTQEGLIGWPEEGTPLKVKVTPERDVWIKSVYPEEKHPELAGGFGYSTAPEGEEVGRVGTGLSTETRKNLLSNPEDWVGRMARIRSQGQFPSGAHRAPVFIARHEDY